MKTTATSGRRAIHHHRRHWGSPRASEAIRTACYGGLIAIALWAPLPFASARPWAWGLLAAAIGALVAALGVSDIGASDDEPAGLSILALPAALFALPMLWAAFQCLPWAPTAWQHPLWHEAATLLPGRPMTPSISVDPAASRTSILRLMTYAGAFWLAYRCCRHAARARLLMAAVAAIGTLYAAWGLGVYWSGNRTVLWFEKWAYWTDLTSTFVNRNSFATYAGLALMASVGLFLDSVLKGVDFTQPPRAIARSLIEFLTTRSIWYIGAIAILATALLLTHSRGGSTATGAGLLALLIAIGLAPSLRGPWRLPFAIMVGLGTLAVLLISGNTTLTRLANTSLDLESRPEVYEITLRLLWERPFLGTGLGTFPTVFAAYRTPDLPFFMNAAHNDYLENMLELGIPAALLLFASLLALFAICVSGVFRRRRDAVMPCVGVGATVLVAAHSLVDFSLQIPAVTIAYMLLLGAAVAQSIPRGVHGHSEHAT